MDPLREPVVSRAQNQDVVVPLEHACKVFIKTGTFVPPICALSHSPTVRITEIIELGTK
jgi:hypothetical protein